VPPPRRPPLMAFNFPSKEDLAAQWNIEQARTLTAQMRARAAGQAPG